MWNPQTFMLGLNDIVLKFIFVHIFEWLRKGLKKSGIWNIKILVLYYCVTHYHCCKGLICVHVSVAEKGVKKEENLNMEHKNLGAILLC